VTLVLVRHAWAGSAETWDGDDRKRPLDERGHRQALGLVELLEQYPISRIISSPYCRCIQSVEPLAASRGLPIEPREELAEERQELDGPALLRALAGTDAVLCTHGGSPWEELAGGEYAKGAVLVLGEDGSVVRALPPPA
jgi:phosphohistidine phosphatase SixA